MGRATQGVTLISLDDGEKLAGLEKVAESVVDGDNESEASTVNPENEANSNVATPIASESNPSGSENGEV